MTTVLLTIGLLLGQVPAPPTSKALHAEYLALIETERKDLAAIADQLAKSGNEEGAAVVRSHIEPELPKGRTRFVPIPDVVPEIKTDATATRGLDEAKKVRQTTAKALFDLATKAASKTVRRYALADRCLRCVLVREPNHAEARRILGFLPYQGGWATPHAIGLLKSGHVQHPKYGWVPSDWVARLDEGELPGEFDANGKPRSWLTAQQANDLHREWQYAWSIDTAPHFQIRSNVDLDESVAFAQRLEVFYQLFMSEFGDLIGHEYLPLANRFDNKKMKATASAKRFQVSYFAEKQEYIDELKRKFGQNEKESLGIYMPTKFARRHNSEPRSYFYKNDGNPIAAHSTLYHEASHQILFETAGKSKYDQNTTNYWVWEALGTYFETVEPQEDGSLLVGGLVGPRIAEARIRILQRGEYVPLAEFTGMGETRFGERKDDAVIRNYQEAMALAVFFMNGEDEKYREAFLNYVVAMYRGIGVRKTSLSDRLGVPFKELDDQFQEFMKSK